MNYSAPLDFSCHWQLNQQEQQQLQQQREYAVFIQSIKSLRDPLVSIPGAPVKYSITASWLPWPSQWKDAKLDQYVLSLWISTEKLPLWVAKRRRLESEAIGGHLANCVPRTSTQNGVKQSWAMWSDMEAQQPHVNLTYSNPRLDGPASQAQLTRAMHFILIKLIWMTRKRSGKGKAFPVTL